MRTISGVEHELRWVHENVDLLYQEIRSKILDKSHIDVKNVHGAPLLIKCDAIESFVVYTQDEYNKIKNVVNESVDKKKIES